MVLGQEREGFFISSLCEKPSGRLRDEPHEENDQDTGKALANKWNAPLVVIVDVVCSISNSRSRDAASKPTAIIETY